MWIVVRDDEYFTHIHGARPWSKIKDDTLYIFNTLEKAQKVARAIPGAKVIVNVESFKPEYIED